MPLILLRLLWRSLSNEAYRKRIPERFGFISHKASDAVPAIKIWVHAVSVGETMAAKPLIDKLIKIYGDQAILVTTTTPTGSDTVQRLFGKKVLHHYYPYDLPFIVDQYLKRIKPDVFVSMETEIWPNLWHSCRKMKIPVVLANARLSSRSTRRYQKVQTFISNVLKNASLIACRNQQDADNFNSIGAETKSVKVLGDIKSDSHVSDTDIQKGRDFKQQWGSSRLVLVAASTHEGEDSLILDLYDSLKTAIDLLLVIAPRHPERFIEVGNLIKKRGFTMQKRSTNKPFSKQTEVVLGDSMGEMMVWFSAADLVFMGGSLVPTGGHNPLEPLACGKAVISGSHVFNFDETYKLLVEQEAAYLAKDIDELTHITNKLLTDVKLRTQIGENGLASISQNRGATDRLVQAIVSLAS